MRTRPRNEPNENQRADLTCGAEFALVLIDPLFPVGDGGLLRRRRRAEPRSA